MGILALDFGGTRTRAAYFDDDLRLLKRAETLSQVDDPQELVIERIIAVGRAVIQGPVQAIGLSAPGPLDTVRGIIYHAWTLPGWQDVPLGDRLTAAFGVPVFCQNDANCGALAEYQAGSGQGCDPLIYLTLSTGIGGGVVLNGRLFTGWGGLAAEPGHQVFRLPDGTVKKLEELASGTAIARIARARLDTWTGDSQLQQCTPLDARAVGICAQAGDPLALELVREAGAWLGLGLVNLVHLFNPRAIVMGGSVTQLGDLLFAPARDILQQHRLAPEFLPPDLLRLAQLGDDVCLIGAAWVAQQALQG